eukprot:CAMPEP_0175981792 /NCGR_PEP_ID=MMETSP0108-20121206/47537_1 /TAXON_ID=195067 ORGANISM="Goniomonas pacifica, Strain CCMP1869" /NCGR_SAMPLE_ID=MMETSP0108 /ASSEMBLY_ACC=CAM_ASM_000204 /LENGTH=48 /DNA_ID= /DNA_START= /DNA_END= /DNA_ORIENTATION=
MATTGSQLETNPNLPAVGIKTFPNLPAVGIKTLSRGLQADDGHQRWLN